MGINFPNSPLQGALYTPPGGYQYVYLDGVWRVVESPQDVGTAQARNRLINGAMQISQENGSTVMTASGTYPADQWMMASGGVAGIQALRGGSGGAWTFAQSFSSVTASPAAGAYHQNMQLIEGTRVSDFLWGTAQAKPVVLRFDAMADVTGLYVVNIQNPDSTRSYLKGFNLTAGVWTTVSLAIPGCTTGVWPVTTAVGLTVRFNTVVGSTYIGIADTWQNNGMLGLPGMVNCAAQANKGLAFTNVGLYLDPLATGVAPRWEMPDEAAELLACQRYYEKVPVTANAIASSYPGYGYKAQKRISTPAIAVLAGAAGSNTFGVLATDGSWGLRQINTVTAVDLLLASNARM